MRKLALTAFVGLLISGLAASSGCKKDEPAAPEPEPEKVAAADESEASQGEKSSLKSALEADDKSDDDEEAPKRKLVKKTDKKNDKKKATDKADESKDSKAEPKKVAAAKGAAADVDADDDEPKTGASAAAKAQAAARKAKSAAERARAAREAAKTNAALARSAKEAAEKADDAPGGPELAKATPPGRKPTVRPARVDPAADDDADDDDPRAAREARRRAAKRPSSRRPVGADEDDDEDAEEEVAGRGPNRYNRGRDRARDRGPRGRDRNPAAARDIPTRAPLPGRVRPNAEMMLRKADLLEVLEYKKAVDVHQLSGIEPDDEYDGIFWGSPNGESYVAGVQIWRPRSPVEAQRRFSRMKSSYPNAEDTDAITNKTFLAYWNDFIYLVFFHTGKQTVVSLTCARTVCDTPQKLVMLGSRIKERL